MKKIFIALVAVMMTMSSCSSSQQFFGTMTGASVGGLFGSSIGGVLGGYRGHDAGRLAGMVIGGAVGAAVTAPNTSNGEYSTSSTHEGSYYENSASSPFADITIENMHFIDSNNSHSLEAGEHAELVFEVRNNGSDYVYDIAPIITVSGTKKIYLSPTAIISELAPGRAVRYKSEVVGASKLKDGIAQFNISLSDGRNKYMMRSFDLRTYRR